MKSQSENEENLNILPNLIIIGAMKCGTTSLHKYLNLHPEVHMSSDKEVDFFLDKNWNKGLNWYQSNFTKKAQIIGESSPNYTKYHAFPGVPERMYKTIPDAKLIYIVRDPIERIISHYMHLYRGRKENRSISSALRNLDKSHYVKCSLYASQLEKFLPYYSLENILVVSLEELSDSRVSTLKKIFAFLNIDSDFEHSDFFKVHHQFSLKQRRTLLGERIGKLPCGLRLCKLLPQLALETIEPAVIDSALKESLMQILYEDINRLRSLTKNPFSNWCL